MADADKTLGVKIQADLTDFDAGLDAAAQRLDKLSKTDASIALKITGISEDAVKRLERAAAAIAKINRSTGAGKAGPVQVAPAGQAPAAGGLMERMQATRVQQAQPVGTGPQGTVHVAAELKAVSQTLRADIEEALKAPFDVHLKIANLDELKRQLGELGGFTIHAGNGGRVPMSASEPSPTGMGPGQRVFTPAFQQAIGHESTQTSVTNMYHALNDARKKAGQQAMAEARNTADMFATIVDNYGSSLKEIVQLGDPNKIGLRPITGGSIADMAKGDAGLRTAARDFYASTGSAFPAYRHGNMGVGEREATSSAISANLAANGTAIRQNTEAVAAAQKANGTAPGAAPGTGGAILAEKVAAAAVERAAVGPKGPDVVGMTQLRDISHILNETASLYQMSGKRGSAGTTPLSIAGRSVAGAANVMNQGINSPMLSGRGLMTNGIELADILEEAVTHGFRGYAQQIGANNKGTGQYVQAVNAETPENIVAGLAGKPTLAPGKKGTIPGQQGVFEGVAPSAIVRRMLVARGVPDAAIDELLRAPVASEGADAKQGILNIALAQGGNVPLPQAMRSGAAKGGLYTAQRAFSGPDSLMGPTSGSTPSEVAFARLKAYSGTQSPENQRYIQEWAQGEINAAAMSSRISGAENRDRIDRGFVDDPSSVESVRARAVAAERVNMGPEGVEGLDKALAALTTDVWDQVRSGKLPVTQRDGSPIVNRNRPELPATLFDHLNYVTEDLKQSIAGALNITGKNAPGTPSGDKRFMKQLDRLGYSQLSGAFGALAGNMGSLREFGTQDAARLTSRDTAATSFRDSDISRPPVPTAQTEIEGLQAQRAKLAGTGRMLGGVRISEAAVADPLARSRTSKRGRGGVALSPEGQQYLGDDRRVGQPVTGEIERIENEAYVQALEEWQKKTGMGELSMVSDDAASPVRKKAAAGIKTRQAQILRTKKYTSRLDPLRGQVADIDAQIAERQKVLGAAGEAKTFANDQRWDGMSGPDVMASPEFAALPSEQQAYLRDAFMHRTPGHIGTMERKPGKERRPSTGQQMSDKVSQTLPIPGSASRPSVIAAVDRMLAPEAAAAEAASGGGGGRGRSRNRAVGSGEDDGGGRAMGRGGIVDVRIVSPVPVPVTLAGGSAGPGGGTMSNLNRVSRNLAPDSKFNQVLGKMRSDNPNASEADIREALERIGFGAEAAAMFGAPAGRGGRGGRGAAASGPPAPEMEKRPRLPSRGTIYGDAAGNQQVGNYPLPAMAASAMNQAAADAASRASQENQAGRAARAAAAREAVRANAAVQGGLKVRTVYGVPLGDAGLNTVPQETNLLPAMTPSTAAARAEAEAIKASKSARGAPKAPKDPKVPPPLVGTPSRAALRAALVKQGISPEEIAAYESLGSPGTASARSSAAPGGESAEDLVVRRAQAQASTASKRFPSRAIGTATIQLVQSAVGGLEDQQNRMVDFKREVADLQRLANERRGLVRGRDTAQARVTQLQGFAARGSASPELTAELKDATDALAGHTKSVDDNKKAIDEQGEMVDEMGKGLSSTKDVLKFFGAGLLGGVAGGLITGGVSMVAGVLKEGLSQFVDKVAAPAIERATGNAGVANRTNAENASAFAQGGYTRGGVLSALVATGMSGEQLGAMGGELADSAGVMAGNRQLAARTAQQQTYFANLRQRQLQGLPEGYAPGLIRDQGGVGFYNPLTGGFMSAGGETNTQKLLADSLGEGGSRFQNRRSDMIDSFLMNPFGAETVARLTGTDGTASKTSRLQENIAAQNATLADTGSDLRFRIANPDLQSDKDLLAAQGAVANAAKAEDLANAMTDFGLVIENLPSDVDAAKLAILDMLKAIGTGKLSPSAFMESQKRGLANQGENMRLQFELQQRAVGAGAALGNIASPLAPFGQGVAGGVEDLQGYKAIFDQYKSVLDARQQQQEPLLNSLIGTDGQAVLGNLKDVTAEIVGLNKEAADIGAVQQFREYNHQLVLARRGTADLAGLVGRSGASEVGILERQNMLAGRKLQLMQLEDQQRSLNFQRAMAGFTFEGATGEEAADRQRIAEIRGRRAQTELNISKGMNQGGIKIVDEQNLRAFQEAIFQETELQKKFNESRRLQVIGQAVAAAQRLQAQFEEEIKTFLSRGNAIEASGIEWANTVADATGKLLRDVYGEATKVFRDAIIEVQALAKDPLGTETGTSGTGGQSPDERDGVGDSNVPWVQPGGRTVYNLAINNPVVRNDGDLREIARQVEHLINRKASLMGAQRVRPD